MHTACNPKRCLQGDRNVFCTHYGDCLDHAVSQEWPSWDCTRCVFLTDRGDAPEMQTVRNHAIAYYEIPAGP